MIQHVSSTGDNGILLGYGAPFFDPTMPRVIVFSESNPRRIYASFSTSLDRRVAARCAEARLGEIACCTDDTMAYLITGLP